MSVEYRKQNVTRVIHNNIRGERSKPGSTQPGKLGLAKKHVW